MPDVQPIEVKPLGTAASLEVARRLGRAWGSAPVDRAFAMDCAPPAGTLEWTVYWGEYQRAYRDAPTKAPQPTLAEQRWKERHPPAPVVSPPVVVAAPVIVQGSLL